MKLFFLCAHPLSPYPAGPPSSFCPLCQASQTRACGCPTSSPTSPPHRLVISLILSPVTRHPCNLLLTPLNDQSQGPCFFLERGFIKAARILNKVFFKIRFLSTRPGYVLIYAKVSPRQLTFFFSRLGPICFEPPWNTPGHKPTQLPRPKQTPHPRIAVSFPSLETSYQALRSQGFDHHPLPSAFLIHPSFIRYDYVML